MVSVCELNNIKLFRYKTFRYTKINYYYIINYFLGIFCGGYHYSLKMYTYERVRARNFARTWGFVQFSQAIPIVIGVPFSGKLIYLLNSEQTVVIFSGLSFFDTIAFHLIATYLLITFLRCFN